MVCKIHSLGLHGVTGYPVTAECDLSGGLPAFSVVGLPDAAVSEARERVRAAIKNCGFTFPVSRITVNLAPADRKKAGTVYDLPILVGILAAGEQLKLKGCDHAAFLGELSLSGALRPVPGMLPMAAAAKKAGITTLYVPSESAAEATLAGGMTVYGVENVPQLLRHLSGEERMTPVAPWRPEKHTGESLDFADVKGQEQVKRALEIAAAGGHNLLMIGPPGSGKSMLARRLPSILPDMTPGEALEATEVYSVLGLTTAEEPLLTRRPFRSPHHTISPMGMAGGGAPLPRPGEISLAHNGVLFLDELPEFRRDVLEVLRQPMEDGQVQISRATGSEVFPQPVHAGVRHEPLQVRVVRAPLRPVPVHAPGGGTIDIRIVRSPAGPHRPLCGGACPGAGGTAAGRPGGVLLRHQGPGGRRPGGADRAYGPRGPSCNAHMGPKELREYCKLDEAGEGLLKGAFERMGLTARSHDRILRLARTIADLDGSETIEANHLAEAIQYRASAYFKH